MNLEDLEPYRRIETRGEARETLDRTLRAASRHVRILDDTGEFYGFERAAFAEAIESLLRRHSEARVTIVLHDCGRVETRCPRLVSLLRAWGPRLTLLQTEASIRDFSRGFAIFDDALVMRRPHFDRRVTIRDADEKEVAAALSLFEQVLQQSSPPHWAGVTGLG